MCHPNGNVEQVDLLFDPVFQEDQKNYQVRAQNDIYDILIKLNSTASFLSLFSSLWHTRTPCFDLKGITAQNDREQSLLKYCEWKGLEIPCSDIFTSFPTDQGMCCSFNMGAAENIFIASTYLRVIQNLQDIDKTMAFNSMNNQYARKGITKSQLKIEPGKSKGLTVILDAHSDFYSSTSFSSDTQGFTGQISKSGSFPQRSMGSFDINPGHNNLVTISATIINSDDSLKNMDPIHIRKCYFEWENSFMKLFKNYTQTNCLLECKLFNATYMMKQKYNSSYNDCLPWNFPSPDVNPFICDPWQTVEINELMSKTPYEECQKCIPDCVSTIFKSKVTAVPLRNCSLINIGNNTFCNAFNPSRIKPNMLSDLVVFNIYNRFRTLPYYVSRMFSSSQRKYGSSLKHGDVFESTNYPYSAFNKDIAKVQLYFDSATMMGIQRSSTMTSTDFFSNVGGIFGLVLGMGLISLAELLWIIIHIFII
jgi:hypothetical protein